MAAILQMMIPNALFWMKIFVFKISLKFVPKGPIDYNPVLV